MKLAGARLTVGTLLLTMPSPPGMDWDNGVLHTTSPAHYAGLVHVEVAWEMKITPTH